MADESVFLQPCLSSGIFGKRPLAESARAIAEAGFRYIEISRRSSHWAEAAPVLAGEGVRVWSIHGPGIFFLDEPSGEAWRCALEAEYATMMTRAAPYAPCPYVLHYLRQGGGRERDERSVERIDQLARRCREAGLTLCLELLPAKAGAQRHAGDAAELTGLLDQVASGPVSVCVDMNHTNLVEDLPDAIRTCRGRIGNVHISDNLGLTDDHLPPGEGIIDWPPVLRALCEAGYRGPLNMEVHSKEVPSREMLVRLREWAVASAQFITPSADGKSDGP